MMQKPSSIFFWFLVLTLTACSGLSLPLQEEQPVQNEPSPQVTDVWTAVPTIIPTKTEISTVTSTTTLTPTIVPQITLTITPEPAFRPQTVNPVYLPNFNYPGKGCSWMGIAGQIFDASNEPAKDLVIVIQGELAGMPVDSVSLTGQAPAYGPGGYEISLADKPIASEKTLSIQIFDLQGNPVSAPYAFDTLSDCQKNLGLINFSLQAEGEKQYFPMIVQ